MQKKHIALLSIAIVAVVAIIGGLTYALWSSTSTQTGDNVITTGCFNITFEESAGSDINLQSAFPITDSDGMNTTPYGFTIENTCDIAANYAANFEVSGESTLSTDYLKIALNTNTPHILSEYTSTTATIAGRSAYQLTTGSLAAGVKESYAFRMWLDEDAPQSEAQSKTLSGKIVITTTPVASEPSYPLATAVINNLALTDTTTMNTDDPDGNVRYMGANPSNYVTFNDESWRIIGVFDVAPSASGTKEKRVKLIRTDSIGNYSWDSSASEVNGGRGVNEWSQADIMTTLNSGAYWNRTSGTCYSGQFDASSACDFSSTGLTSDAKALIGDAYWNTGTTTNDWLTSANSTDTAVQLYSFERSTNNGKICSNETYCNDTVTRTTGWVGKVGLMYPSDYGYATSGGSTTNRATCLTTALYSWSGSEVSDCKNNSWLLNSSLAQWTLTPVPLSQLAYFVFYVNTTGQLFNSNAYNANGVHPVVYLNSSVLITGGDGTSENPYTLGL